MALFKIEIVAQQTQKKNNNNKFQNKWKAQEVAILLLADSTVFPCHKQQNAVPRRPGFRSLNE